MDEKELLIRGADELDIKLSKKNVEDFFQYKNILLEWNEKMNLTAITDPQDVIIKHFLDSLTVLQVIEPQAGRKMIDVGTGAGFPGVPVKIMRPDIQLTLLDSLNKRVHFLKALTEALSLADVECIHARAEDAGQNPLYREQYDVCFSRAVANLSALAEYCLPFVKIGGQLIAMKGPAVTTEISTAKNAISKLGGQVLDIITIKIPFTDMKHSLCIISKLRHTPAAFPRNPSKITKSPII